MEKTYINKEEIIIVIHDEKVIMLLCFGFADDIRWFDVPMSQAERMYRAQATKDLCACVCKDVSFVLFCDTNWMPWVVTVIGARKCSECG